MSKTTVKRPLIGFYMANLCSENPCAYRGALLAEVFEPSQVVWELNEYSSCLPEQQPSMVPWEKSWSTGQQERIVVVLGNSQTEVCVDTKECVGSANHG